MIEQLPSDLVEVLARTIGSSIRSFHFAGGGCINAAGNLVCDKGDYFLKWNKDAAFPNMLETEAKGLHLLHSTQTVRVPRVLEHGVVGENQFLLLEWIASTQKTNDYWEVFAQQLSSLHRQTRDRCGLDFDNYIGSLRQKNQFNGHNSTEFFVEYRLLPQLKTAVDEGLLAEEDSKKFEILFSRLPELLPEEPPALLHGDLWSGNVIVDETGSPCFLDPAVYYGNREVDLAMTMLFGGFDVRYLEVYNSHFPLIPGYNQRFELYNLYPLLVHVNLFGKTYVRQVVSILNKFV